MNQILVGIDETSEAESAIRLAHRLSVAFHAQVVAVEVVEPEAAEHTPDDVEHVRTIARQRLERWLPRDLVSTLSIEVVAGSVESALLQQARNHDAICVIIGSPSNQGSHPRGLGSIPHALAHDLDCPLIVVPRIAVDELTNDVIVGIDGSAASQVSLDMATDFTTLLGGTTYAVYAIDDIYTTFVSHGYFGTEEEQARHQAEAATEPVEFVERLGGSTEDILSDVVKEHNALLLIVAARDRHSMTGAVLGAVPRHLLRQPPCPVMFLPYTFTKMFRQPESGQLV